MKYKYQLTINTFHCFTSAFVWTSGRALLAKTVTCCTLPCALTSLKKWKRIDQSVKQSTCQSINQSICQPINLPVSQSVRWPHLSVLLFFRLTHTSFYWSLHPRNFKLLFPWKPLRPPWSRKASAFSLDKDISPSSKRVEMNNAPLSEGDWKSGQWRSGYSVGRSAFSKALVNSLESTKIPYLRIAQLPVLAQNCWLAMKKRQ